MKREDANFSVPYSLKFNMTDKVHALMAWFDTDFADLENPVTLSTSPFCQSTHWKQTVFYLDHELDVRKGDVLQGSFCTRQGKVNFRELDIKVSYHLEAKQCT